MQERNRLEGDKHWLWCVNFSPNGQMIATACSSGSVKIWNSQGRFLNCLKDPTIEEYKAHKTEVISVSFSPDSQTLASATEDTTVKLWDINSFNQTYVSFSPDGQIIATTSRDGTVKLWSLDGKELKSLEGHNCPVSSVSFSPNRFNLKIWTMLLSIDYLASILYLPKLFIVSTNENGQLIIWNLDNLELVELKNLNLDKLLQKACKHLGNYLKTHPRQGICQ